MFAQIYNCPVHGDTWNVEVTEVIDQDNDDVYTVMLCPICEREIKPVIANGKQVVHMLTEEEMKEELYWNLYDIEDEEDQ